MVKRNILITTILNPANQRFQIDYNDLILFLQEENIDKEILNKLITKVEKASDILKERHKEILN